MAAVTFTANGEYLVAGVSKGVLVWRVRDGKKMATWAATSVLCVAASTDGRWVAAGTLRGCVLVWDANTHEQVSAHREELPRAQAHTVHAVDFSPDSTRLIASNSSKTTIRDVSTRRHICTLDHGSWEVRAAKYSPQGDRIATATRESVQIWDSNDGRLLVDIKVQVIPWRNAGLLWSNNHLFVVSNNQIKEIDAFTGSIVLEWAVPEADDTSCIALRQRGKFIAYSAEDAITFWDTSTGTRLLAIPLYLKYTPIALSPDGRLFACISPNRKLSVNRLAYVAVSFMSLLYGASESDLAFKCPSIITHRIQFLRFVYTTHFSNQRFICISTRLCSTRGSMIISWTRKHC